METMENKTKQKRPRRIEIQLIRVSWRRVQWEVVENALGIVLSAHRGDNDIATSFNGSENVVIAPESYRIYRINPYIVNPETRTVDVKSRIT